MLQKSDFKFVLQKESYDCGVAATATLLVNSGYKKVNYKKLGKDLKLSTKGVLSDNIVEYVLKIANLRP